jgi:hypothetical protein
VYQFPPALVTSTVITTEGYFILSQRYYVVIKTFRIISMYTWWTVCWICRSRSGLCFCSAVVLQYYEVQVFYSRNVIRGNTAVLKCTIPSFVREYITVTSWVQDSKFNIYPTTKGGKLLLRHSILCQHNLFNHFIYPPSTCQEDSLPSATRNIPDHTLRCVTVSSPLGENVLSLFWSRQPLDMYYIASLITAGNSIKPAIILHAFL